MEDLERAIIAGELDEETRTHIAVCSPCREAEEMIRDNIAFMGGVREHLNDTLGAQSRPVLEPDVFPGYHLLREIARGGQGVVYEGVQIETKRRVAVKMIEASGPDGRGRRRFEREAELAASLRHPNIVSIYQRTTLPDGRHALAMEYVDGVAIDQWARAVDAAAPHNKDGFRGAVRIKLRAIATVCDAVQHAHVNGVIHRDLKPANVLVMTSTLGGPAGGGGAAGGGVPRVVDFGIARRVEQDTHITRTGAFAGTLAYASPEQVSGDPSAVDTRADVYSLGLILYEVLSARRPYDTAGSLSGAIANITRTTPPPLSKIQPGDQVAGDELEAIVEKALAKNRSERYQSAAALKSDLDNWLAGRPVLARQHSTVYMLRKLAARHRVGFTVAAGLILILAVLAGIMAWSSRSLAHQKSLLAASLASSTIERGRLVGLSGENSRAEELIWPEVIKLGLDPADDNACFTGKPEILQATWALFELYSRHPSLAHYPVLKGAEVMRFEDNDRAIRLIRPDGSQEVRSVADGRILESLTGNATPTDVWMLLDSNRSRALTIIDGGINIIDAGSTAHRTLTDPRLRGKVIDMSRDGSRLIEVDDSTLRLWQTEPLQPIRELATNISKQSRPRFSMDGRTVAAGVQDRAQLWNADTGEPTGEWRIPPALWASVVNAPINAIQFSPDSKMLAAGFHNSMLLFGDSLANPREVNAAHRGFVSWLEFSGNGKVLISLGSERACKTWDPATGTLLGSFEQSTPVRGVPTLSSDGSLIAVCDRKDLVRVFESRPRQWLTQLTGPENTVHGVRFSPDGATIGAVSSDGSLRLWDRTSKELRSQVRIPGGASLEALSFAPDGASIAVAGRAGWIGIVNTAAPSEPTRLTDCADRITWLAHSPAGSIIAAAGETYLITLYDATTGEKLGELKGHANRIIDAVFSKDGATLVSVGGDGACIQWDIASRTERSRTEPIGAPTRAVCLSPDGASIITGSDDWKIRIFSAKTGKLEKTIAGAKQHVFGLAMHPKGNVLISCTRDSVIQVWDIRTGRELAVLGGHNDLVLSMAISPDGLTLLTGSADRTVGLWDLGYYRAHLKGNHGVWKDSLARQ
jgi:WD40 repeat protein/serine/threonine protein kinase